MYTYRCASKKILLWFSLRTHLLVATEQSPVNIIGVSRPDRRLLSAVEAAAEVGTGQAGSGLVQQCGAGVTAAAPVQHVEDALQTCKVR